MTALEHLDHLEAGRIGLLAEVATLDAQVVEHRPAPDQWSIREILEHMVLAERDVLRGLFDPKYLIPRSRTLRHRILRRVVMVILGVGIPVKAPSQAMIPKGDRTLDEIVRMWEDNHARMRRYLESLDAEGHMQAVFRHPIGGPLTPAQAVSMASVHLTRHTGQIRRLIAAHA